MAEAAGLALGTLALASLFQTCMDFFETVEVARSFEIDGELAVTKVNLLRARLRQWGRCLHVQEPGHEIATLRENWPHDGELIITSLLGIHHMLGSSSQVIHKYGLEAEKKASIWSVLFSNYGEPHDIPSTASPPSCPLSNSPHSLLRKQACWAIRDKKKLDTLIVEIDFLITNLEKVSQHMIPPDNTKMSRSNHTQTRDHAPWDPASRSSLVQVSRALAPNYQENKESQASRDYEAGGRPPPSGTNTFTYSQGVQLNPGNTFHHRYHRMVAGPRSLQVNGDLGFQHPTAAQGNYYSDEETSHSAVQVNGNTSEASHLVELFKVVHKEPQPKKSSKSKKSQRKK